MDINLPMSPPVNNNIQISENDRLDAIVFERIRVANTQLDSRLSIQEKLINKYRQDVEKVHAHQAQRLRREVKKIRQKKPDYVFDDSDLSSSKSRITTETGRQRCKSEPSYMCYCRRYYSHHYNLKDTSKDEKKEKDSKKKGENDFFNMKLRLYFINMMNNIREKTHLNHDNFHEQKESNSSMDLGDSFDQSRPRLVLARHISTDEENDDVFSNSHSSLYSLRDLGQTNNVNGVIKRDYTRITEEDEKTISTTESGLRELYREPEIARKDDPTKITANATFVDRKGRHRNRKIKRRSIIGSGSEAEYNETERRKSKNAFEKIFAGLL